jgi:hypothetical protein
VLLVVAALVVLLLLLLLLLLLFISVSVYRFFLYLVKRAAVCVAVSRFFNICFFNTLCLVAAVAVPLFLGRMVCNLLGISVVAVAVRVFLIPLFLSSFALFAAPLLCIGCFIRC